jgi:hypothetical protein
LTVWPVIDLAFGDLVSELPVAVIIHYGANGSVNWQLLPIHTQTGELCIEVREIAALEERIVGEANSFELLFSDLVI